MASLDEILNQSNKSPVPEKKTLSLAEITGEQPVVKQKGLLDEFRSSISEEFGGIVSDTKSFVKEGFQSIKETIQASPAERKQTLTDAGKKFLEMPKTFAQGLYDIARIQIPKTASTLATAVLDNTRIRIGLGLPGIDFLNIGGDTVDRLSYEPEAIKEARQKASQWTDDITSMFDQKQQDRIKELGITADTSIFDPSNFGYKLASGAGSMGLAFGLAVVTKNPTLAVGALGLLEGSESYNEARVKLKEQNPEMSKEQIDRQAMNSATVNTVGIALLERVGLDFLFRTYGGGTLRKMAINSITETLQETSQTIWSNTVARFGYDKTQNIFADTIETILLTMPIGFFGGGVIGGEADTQLLTEGLPNDVVKKVATQAGISEDEAKEIIKEVIPAIDEEVNKTATKIEADESRDTVAEELASGKTPNQVALELSEKLGADEAIKLVDEVVSGQTQETVETSPETKPKTALEDTSKALADITDTIDDTILDKTPEDIQIDFDNAQKKFEEDITQIKNDIADIKERITKAPDRSAEKAKAKEALTKAQQRLKKAEADFNDKITNQAGSFREFLSNYINTEINLDLSGKDQSDLIDNIVVQITDPEIVIKNMGATLRNVIAREVQRLNSRVAKVKGVADMTADEIENERIRLVNKRLAGELTTEENAVLDEIIKKKVAETKQKDKKEDKKEEAKKKEEKKKPVKKETVKNAKKFTAWKKLFKGEELIKLKDSWGSQFFQTKAKTPEALSQVKPKPGGEKYSFEDVSGTKFTETKQIGTATSQGKDILVFGTKEDKIFINKTYYEAISSLHPDAKLVFVQGAKTGNEIKRLGFVEDGVVKAVIMPMELGRTPDITFIEEDKIITPIEAQQQKAEELAEKQRQKIKEEEALKAKEKQDDTTNKGTRDRDNKGTVPEPIQPSTDEQGGAGGTTVVKQGGGRSDGDTNVDVGGRPRGAKIQSIELEKGKKYTNKEIETLVNELTTIENGEVKLTNSELISDEVLEAINQYEVGGTLKEGRGILDEYFTSSKIVDVVSEILNVNKNVKVLEPSVGSGNFVYAIPQNYRTLDALEINPITAGISKIFHNDINVRTDPFESLFVDKRGNAKEFKADYDLVIGNPPYGAHRGLYKGLGEENKISRYEVYFLKRSLDLLKEGGTVAMVVPSGLLRGGSNYGKIAISKNAVLQEAWRLPNGSFESTDIGTDILIFKKETNTKENTLDLISADKYFIDNPNNILGTQGKRKGQFGLEPYVGGSLDEAINMFSDRRTEMLSRKLLTDNNIEITDESVSDAENTLKDQTDKVDPKVTAEKIKEDIKKKKVISKIKKDTEVIVDKNRQIRSISELVSDLSAEEISIWEKTNTEGWVENPTEAEKEILNFYNDNYYNDFNYAQGDIYEKLDILESEKSKIKEGKYQEQKSKLLAVVPKVETTETIKVPPNHTFVGKVKLSDGNSLRSNFLAWLNDLPSDVFGSSSEREIRGYINKEQVRGNDKKYNERVRERRKTKAEELFKKYLVQLEGQDKTIVEKEYNQQYNSYYKPKFDEVPLFSKIYATFKGKKFGLRNAQKEALGMIATRGNAIIGLEVGNGKTIVGIFATTEAMHRGLTKRPIWVVPNPSIATQWIKTAQDLIPNIKINNLGNLGGDLKNVKLEDLEIKEGEITILTQKGLTALSFTDETYTEMSEKFKYVSDELLYHKSKRQKAKDKTDTEGIAGAMKRKTRGDVTFEKLGFDFMVFDEVQMANHIVSKVKMEKGESTDFKASETTSDIGMKTWLASQYIQSRNNGRGFIGLSATPFTNNPLEYYSVISLVGQKYLDKIGATNINDFFSMFMEASTEYEVRPNGSIEKKNDIRGFKNNRQWKNLLNQFAVFAPQPKDIIVPDKFNKSYYIPQNEMQMEFNLRAQDLFKDPVAGSLLGVGEMKKIAFSPFLSKYYDGKLTKADYKKFVDGSPKIKATMELIKQNKKDRPEAGQIIYTAAIGKDTSPLMQEYLIKELGFKTGEVGIINGDTPQGKRIEFQEKYNNGEMKVIIGSDAIQVGVELQINSTDLYIIGMPWNFTALKQVTGRIHRQNNKWKNVRINIMMSENSADVFQMQKIQNKQDRYEASILNDAQEIDLGDIDSEEMKADLMTDPIKKAQFIIQQKTEILKDKIETAKSEQAFALRKFEKLNKALTIAKQFEDNLNSEKELQEEKSTDEKDDYWLNYYREKLNKAQLDVNKIIGEYKEKGIDVEKLQEIQERTAEEINKLEAEKKANEEGEADLIKKIASEMPILKTFSDNDLKLFVSERETENKTFYELRAEPVSEDIKVEETVKEIKNASGTKVVKTKKTATVKKEATKKVEESATPRKGTKNVAMLKILTDPKLTVQQKVDTLLEKKQEGKKYKDVGDRVAGSKKENTVIQAVIENGDSEILRQLANELGNETVLAQLNKQKLLEDIETPTAESERIKGTPAWLANYKINVFNKINRVPRTQNNQKKYGESYVSESAMENFIVSYPEALIKFVTDLNNISTLEEAQAFGDKYGNYLTRMRVEATFEDKIRLNSRRERISDENSYNYIKDPAERAEALKDIDDQIKNGVLVNVPIDVLGTKFGRTSMSLGNVREDGKFLHDRWGTPVYLQIKDAQKVLKSENGVYTEYDDYYEKNKYSAIDFTVVEDSSKKTYRGGYREDTYEEALANFKTNIRDSKLNEKEVIAKAKADAEALIKNFNENYDLFLPKIEVGVTKQIKDAEKNIQDLEKSIARYEESVKKEPDSKYNKEQLERQKDRLVKAKEFLARLKGETEAIKHGNFSEIEEYDVKESRFAKPFVKADNLMKVYGFKSAQLGNYMDDVSSREHITQTMASMEDMSKVIGLDFAKISNDMGLSIAFGARGGGGSAVAHFEPAHKIINITKRRGDGSFGHEFMHALDFILGSSTYRGKWSNGTGYGHYKYTVAGDNESMLITRALLNGVEVDTDKTFTPRENVSIESIDENIVKLREEGKTLEESIEKVANISNKSQHNYFYQDIADLYRKEFTTKVKTRTNDYYKKSNEYGGGKASYWTRKEELWARAFQAYLEDKLNEAGIKNNYLTRSTIGVSVYPQGAERVEYNKLFDKLFETLKSKYPLPEKLNDLRFKSSGEIESTYTLTDAGNYIADVKKRLGIDFDVMFVDNILSGRTRNIFGRDILDRVELYGATADNTIALVKDMAEYTAEHETVHLTLQNMDRISIFKRNGLNKENILSAQAEKMGVKMTEKNEIDIEEQLAIDFEKYVKENKLSKGILNKFFRLLKEVLNKFARAIGITKGNLIEDYFDVLLEGKNTEEEVVRLENMGVMEAFLEDGVLDFEDESSDVKFKIKDEGDKRIANLKQTINELEARKAELEEKTTAWKAGIEEKLKIASENAKIIDEVDLDTKELARFTKRTPPVGGLTERGAVEVGNSKFQNVEEAQSAVMEYLKRKTDLLETRNQLRKLKKDIIEAKKSGKDTERNLRDIERRLKLRKALLEKQDFYIGRGIARGRKAQMTMIRKRGVVLKSVQRFIGLSDERAKKLIRGIGRERIFLMGEKQFNDFMLEFFNRGTEIVNTLDERSAVEGLIQEMNFQGEENVRKALGLPAISKMTEEQALRFNRVLSNYQMGDVFLTQRTLETIHRTDWGDVRTYRELSDKILKSTGVTIQDLKDLNINYTADIVKNGLELSNKNPMLRWLVDRRIKADIQATAQYVAFEEELNPMINKARSSRNKGIIGKVRQFIDIAPIDTLVFDYIESEDKANFAKKNNMTVEEVELGQFLIARLFEPARQYMMSEYGMKDRSNYITHIRRSFAETFMQSVRKDGIKGISTGIKDAVMELLSAQKEDEATFNILSGKTGEVVAFEKWFKFAMPRSGKLQPSKNVAKASLAYAQAYFKKLSVDELVPEAMSMLKIQQQVQGFTDRGLPVNAQNEQFIKAFINDAKGRKIEFLNVRQGSNLESMIKLGISWTALRLLGGRFTLQMASFVGEMVTTIVGTTNTELLRGLARTFDFSKVKSINEANKFFTGRNPFSELLDPRKGLGMRAKEALFLVFSIGRFLNSRLYLRAKMTEQEWNDGIIQDDRLVEVIKEMNKWKNGQFYVKSLAGNTTAGASFSQFISWAFPILTTTLNDIKILSVKASKGQFAKNEIMEVFKVVRVAGLLWLLATLIKSRVDDDDEIAGDFQTTKGERDMWFYITRELNTIIGAFNILANLDNVNPLLRDLFKWSESVMTLLSMEKYKIDGKDYAIGDLKGAVAMRRLVTPVALGDYLYPQGEKQDTEARLINEAITGGEFDPKSIAETLRPDEWNNVQKKRTEEEQLEYRAKLVGEIEALYYIRKNYEPTKMVDIVLGNETNKEKVDIMLEYAKEVGVDKAYEELKKMKKDKNLCSNVKKGTGCIVSDQLFSLFRDKKKKLLE